MREWCKTGIKRYSTTARIVEMKKKEYQVADYPQDFLYTHCRGFNVKSYELQVTSYKCLSD